jgi:hypothetical protein
MGTVRGYRKGTSLLWVRRGTAERPSPLRVCSYLTQNALTGSVPSWLSALTNLESLCVAPSCQRRLRLRLRRVGSVGSAPSARHVGGCIERGHRGGGAAAGLLRCSQRGPRARDVTKEYSRGTPPMGYGARVLSGHIVAVGAAWYRRAAESASGVQRPQQQ